MRTQERSSIKPAQVQRPTSGGDGGYNRRGDACRTGQEKATDLDEQIVDKSDVQRAREFFASGWIAGPKHQPH